MYLLQHCCLNSGDVMYSSGGTLVTVHGQYLDSVAWPRISIAANGQPHFDVNAHIITDWSHT